MLCLTATLQLYSQKVSNERGISDTNCIVPCNSLRSALIYKSGAQLKISFLKDSLCVLTEIVASQDSAIFIKNEKIKTLEDNATIMKGKEVEHIKALETYKTLYSDEKKKKTIAYGVAGGSILLAILSVLL